MASSPPPPSAAPPTPGAAPPLDKYDNQNPLVHTVALGVTPLALLALCLPPRRLNLRAAMLGGVALWGTNQLVHDYSGRSFGQRLSARMAAISGTELPERARETRERIREARALRALRDDMVRSGAAPPPAASASGGGLEGWTDEQKRALVEAYERQRREGRTVAVEGKAKERGVLEKIWMGNAEPDWKEKRDQREKEALKEGGGGYWGLITDQIAEVWSGGKKEEGDVAKEKTGDDEKKS
ncbi:hypothetical protein F4802DRAFT_619286 [Xylaria palmicola]|nr:hypothetical protein F4802DRAFT_619286 [Xylaria palmicola]